MNKLRKLTCLLLVVLCMTSFTVPALAYADDSAAATPTESTTVEEPDPTTPATDDEEDVEIPYTFTISEDGSVVISINGVEWDIDLEDEEDDSTTGRVTTNGGRLNLRTGAGMSYQIIDQLRNGEEVTVIGTEGDWYKVVIPEKTGYVHSDYLELLGEADENSEIDSAMLMLMCIYDTGTRTGLMDALATVKEQLEPDETELRAMTDSALKKLEAMTDEEYSQLELFPDFDDEEELDAE